MKEKITITKEATVICCDFCENKSNPDSNYMDGGIGFGPCVKCGKDTCYNHDIEACEDGLLCPECSKEYCFEHEDGCVGIVNKDTGQFVEGKHW